MLAAQLRALRTDEFDFELIGCDGATLARLLGETAPDAPMPGGGEVPVTWLGDLWLLGPHRPLCGDATRAADVAQLLDGARPQLMTNDRPYGVNYDPE